MIVVDLDDNVLGSAPQIYRTNRGGEFGIIVVNMYPDQEFGYFCIGTQDRDRYTIYEDITQPDPDRIYKFYVKQHPDGAQYYEFVDITPEPPNPIP